MPLPQVWSHIKDRTILVCLALAMLVVAYARNHNNMGGMIWADTEGYYMYLPAVFIQHSVHHVPERSMHIKRNAQGEAMMKYTCGVAFFYLPFFLASHAYAHLFHYDTSGFSTPYYYGIMLCGVFWSMIGAALLLQILRRNFSRTIAWATLVCVVLGTNFFFYSTRWMGMSHIYNFALFAGLLLLVDNYYKQPKTKIALAVASLLGVVVLIRPTNIVVLVFLLLFRVVSVTDLKERIHFLKGRLKDVALALPLFALPLVPQLLYWKEMTGHWVSYSYSGETFMYWNNPRILAVLFDTQNGLLLYSPILLLMFAGVIVAKKDRRSNTLGTLITFAIITYIFASWWAWWFGAAFGHRCYIEFYPLFALTMGVAIERLLGMKKVYVKNVVLVLMGLCIVYNIGLTRVFDHSGIWDGPAWRWNWPAWWEQVKQIVYAVWLRT